VAIESGERLLALAAESILATEDAAGPACT
jgi:hypothetical protein